MNKSLEKSLKGATSLRNSRKKLLEESQKEKEEDILEEIPRRISDGSPVGASSASHSFSTFLGAHEPHIPISILLNNKARKLEKFRKTLPY